MELFQGYISEVNMDEGELHLDVIFDDADWYSAPAEGELQHVPPPARDLGSIQNKRRPQHQSKRGGAVTRRMARAKANIQKRKRRRAKVKGKPSPVRQTVNRRGATQPTNYQENIYQHLSRLGLFYNRAGAQKRGRRGAGVAKRGPGQPDGSSPGPEAKG